MLPEAHSKKEGVMPKKTFTKTVAVLVCLTFIAVFVPALNSSEKKATKFSLNTILTQPLLLLSSLFPSLNIYVEDESRQIVATSTASLKKVRPTGDMSIGRPGTGD